MSFSLCKCRYSGKFGPYLVDSVLKIEKVKFDHRCARVLATMVYTGTLHSKRVAFSGFRYMKGYEFDL